MRAAPPKAGRVPTARELFDRRCFLLGITEPHKVERLWAEERAKVEAARPQKKAVRRGR